MTPHGWTISGLAVELNIDRRTAAALVRDLEPVEVAGRVKRYHLADVVAELLRRRGVPMPEPVKRLTRAEVREIEQAIGPALEEMLAREGLTVLHDGEGRMLLAVSDEEPTG